MATSASPQRPQLIHIETARRLGHEWDEWDGKPLPNQGDYSASPALFFATAILTVVAGVAVLAAALYLFWPRLAGLWTPLPQVLAAVAGGAAAVVVLWYLLLVGSFYSRVNLLPERLLERGPFLRLMNLTSPLSRRVGRRDWGERAP